MSNRSKSILIIIAYRMPTLSSKGVHTNHAQLNRKTNRVKSLSTYRTEILKDLVDFIQ